MVAAISYAEDLLKEYVFTVQEFARLTVLAVAGVFQKPSYVQETLYYMDQIGVGSMFILGLTGLFTGMVLTLKGAIQLQPFGAVPYVSRLVRDRKSTRLNSSHVAISYAVFCLKKK